MAPRAENICLCNYWNSFLEMLVACHIQEPTFIKMHINKENKILSFLTQLTHQSDYKILDINHISMYGSLNLGFSMCSLILGARNLYP